jgi:ureidoacrylate peracid hydrolase
MTQEITPIENILYTAKAHTTGGREGGASRTSDGHLDVKKHGSHKLIVMGLIAHTCVESTVRFAVELGYDVTLIKDATADYSDELMHAALVTNLPNYASAIVTTNEVVDSISSLKTLGMSA